MRKFSGTYQHYPENGHNFDLGLLDILADALCKSLDCFDINNYIKPT